MEGQGASNDCVVKDDITTGEESSSHISWYQAKAMVIMKDMLPQYVMDSLLWLVHFRGNC